LGDETVASARLTVRLREKCVQLLDMLAELKESSGRKVAQLFVQLPTKRELPEYYQVYDRNRPSGVTGRLSRYGHETRRSETSAAMEKLRIGLFREIAHAAVSRRPPIPLYTIVARTHVYTYAAKVWDSSIIQGAFSVAPRQRANLGVTTRNLFIAVRHDDVSAARIREPVDWRERRSAVCHQVIAHPMDFTKLRDKLVYMSNVAEFAAEGRRMFDNAQLFNDESSQVSVAFACLP
jgi:hypothetical protein